MIRVHFQHAELLYPSTIFGVEQIGHALITLVSVQDVERAFCSGHTADQVWIVSIFIAGVCVLRFPVLVLHTPEKMDIRV